MFAYRWQEGGPWNSSGIEGTARWIRRTWALFTEPAPRGAAAGEQSLRKLRRKLHQTLRRVTHDFETLEFNTIISSLMELMNEMYKEIGVDDANKTWAKEALASPDIAPEAVTAIVEKRARAHRRRLLRRLGVRAPDLDVLTTERLDVYTKARAHLDLLPPDHVHKLTATNSVARLLDRLDDRLREVGLVAGAKTSTPGSALQAYMAERNGGAS